MSLDSQPQPPFDQPGFQTPPPAPQPPQRGTSGLAVAGLILAFLIAPLGFILSLIAVFKTGAGRAKGRGLAIAGLIVSVLVIAGGIAIVATAANSTVADPGCSAAKDAIFKSQNTVDAASLQTAVDELNAAAAKAKHDNVRAAVKAVAGDYGQLLNAVKTGKVPDGITTKVTADAATLDSLCTIGG